jgi:plastocyanin
MANTAKAGCLLVLNSQGQVVETIHNPLIDGPWDMTALDGGRFAILFVTNVLNGTVAAGGQIVNKGTVVRLVLSTPSTGMPRLLAERVIGTGLGEKSDPAALVIGATGVGLGHDGTLYVADSVGNSIDAISQAITRTTSITPSDHVVSANGALDDPLGLAIAPNGDILSTNGNDGNLVETTPAGAQVVTKTLDSNGTPPGAGALFGLAVAPGGSGVYFVDDATNTLDLLSAAAQVSIRNFAYHPSPLTIKAGGTVMWTNDDSMTHTVTADDGSFDSGFTQLRPGGTFSHMFTAPGTYQYHCSIHTFMHGTVIVTP